MEDVFRRLRRAGIARRDLYLAWDFTIASRQNLTQRLLSMRDRAFAGLGDRNLRDLKVEGSAPSFGIDDVRDVAGARRVAGRVAVPCLLDQAGCPPGSRFSTGGAFRFARRATCSRRASYASSPRPLLRPTPPARSCSATACSRTRRPSTPSRRSPA
jgi:hypothetical protein